MSNNNIKSNKILIVLIVIIAGLFILSRFKDEILKASVSIGMAQFTGSKVTIDSFKFHVFKQQIRIRNLKIYNPQGFPKGVALDVPEADIDYDLPALLKKKLYFSLIVVDLHEISVVRNESGKLNVDSFKFLQNKGAKLQFDDMRFDLVTVTIGRVIYKDLNIKDMTPQVFYVNVRDKSFHNIKGAGQFATLLLFEALKSTAIKNAAIYAVASKFGQGSKVAALVNSLLAPDEATLDFNKSFDTAYTTSLTIIKKQGYIKEENKSTGIIKADIAGTDVVIKVSALTRDRVNVKVSARKLLLPKPDVAGSVMYAIEEKLK